MQKYLHATHTHTRSLCFFVLNSVNCPANPGTMVDTYVVMVVVVMSNSNRCSAEVLKRIGIYRPWWMVVMIADCC
jgi:hypothetical protein